MNCTRKGSATHTRLHGVLPTGGPPLGGARAGGCYARQRCMVMVHGGHGGHGGHGYGTWWSWGLVVGHKGRTHGCVSVLGMHTHSGHGGHGHGTWWSWSWLLGRRKG